MKKDKLTIWQSQPEEVKATYRNEAQSLFADPNIRTKIVPQYVNQSQIERLANVSKNKVDAINDSYERLAQQLFYRDHSLLPENKDQQELSYIVSLIDSAKNNNRKPIKKMVILSELENQDPIVCMNGYIMELNNELLKLSFGLEWYEAGCPYVADINQLRRWVGKRGFKTFIYKLQMLNALEKHRSSLQNNPEQLIIDAEVEKMKLEKLSLYAAFPDRCKLLALIEVMRRYNLLDKRQHANQKHFSAIALIIYSKWMQKTTPAFSKWKRAFLGYCGVKQDTYKINDLRTQARTISNKYGFFSELDDIVNINRTQEEEDKKS